MLITDDMRDEWFSTFSGGKFPIFDPQFFDININDIAASTSKQCRFNGHTKRWHSVARHSVNAFNIVSPRAKPWALFHDGGEAYVSDIITPFKRHLPLVKETEEKIQQKLIERFNIPMSKAIEDEVHAADRYLVFLEAKHLLANPNHLHEWRLERIPFTPMGKVYLGPSLPIIDAWSFKRAFRTLVRQGAICA